MKVSKILFFTSDNRPFNGKTILGCNKDSIPFNYLGVPTFVGAPKFCYFHHFPYQNCI